MTNNFEIFFEIIFLTIILVKVIDIADDIMQVKLLLKITNTKPSEIGEDNNE